MEAITAARFDRPLFILGAPRSGSTLLFETLGRAPRLFTIGAESHRVIEGIPELAPASRRFASNRLAAEDATSDVLARMYAGFWARLRDRDGAPPPRTGPIRMLEKTPKNSLRVPFLRAAFPGARFIYLYRDPHQNLASIVEGWQSGRLVTYPHLPGWNGPPWSMLLVPGWQALRGKGLVEIAAAQWEAANRQILDDLFDVPDDRWYATSYEALIAEPAQEIEGLCRFADLDYDQRLESLRLSSSTRSPPDPDKWRRHEDAIAPLLPALAGTVRRARAAIQRGI